MDDVAARVVLSNAVVEKEDERSARHSESDRDVDHEAQQG